jgi:hypothetical protein
MTLIKERIIEKYFKRQAEKMGALVVKFVSPGMSGVPDRVMIYKGVIWFVELKRPGYNLEPLQEWIHKLFKSHGAKVITLDTKEDVDEFIGTIKSTVL